MGVCLGEEDASDLHAALQSPFVSVTGWDPCTVSSEQILSGLLGYGAVVQRRILFSIYKVLLQLLGVDPSPLLHTSPLDISKSSLLFAKPQAYPSSQALHQCHSAASMLALGRMQGHLLSGCFLSTLHHPSEILP